MNYPLHLSFKILAIAPQIYITDASGDTVLYVKQKLLKLKEAVNVFEDQNQNDLLCTIQADRVIDFSAQYNFASPDGQPLGAVKRAGMRSLFKAHYEILDGEVPDMEINEENPWAKVGDAIFSDIPIVGMFAGYVFHPSYLVTRQDGTPVMRMKKIPAFWEGKFQIDQLADLDELEETRILLSLLMLLLLERQRG